MAKAPKSPSAPLEGDALAHSQGEWTVLSGFMAGQGCHRGGGGVVLGLEETCEEGGRECVEKRLV